ncbi:hypothetical protein KHQ81_01850 [Mycoplasmatota bacterium]|nr:hypothetical protein KHQ81_01850 [Mycoplasmatota bacterium]
MNKVDERILYIIIGILFTNQLFTVWENIENMGWILVITSIVTGFIIYSELFLVRNKEKIYFFSLLTLTTILLITYINIYDVGNSIRNFYFIVLYQIFRVYTKYLSLILFFFLLVLNIVIKTSHLSNATILIQTISSEVSIFLLIVVIIMLIINIIDQNTKLEEMQTELTLKNLDIEHTHNSLLKAYNQLENLTIIQERNKIARDMHDTVGHTLTTALVELEVGKLMLTQQKYEGNEKIKGAIELVRKGLYDLRTSVKTLKDNINYLKEINDLIDNTINHTGVKINYQIDNKLNQLNNPILSCIYRILQEGITNGIKHGNASTFLFNVSIDNTFLELNLDNNGDGTSFLNKGFGVNAMEERVKELNGTIKFHYGIEKGFGIQVFIPLEGRRKND